MHSAINKVGFFRAGLFGDIIVALHGIYATKMLYPHAKLIVYTTHYGELIYPHFWFVDEVVNIESHEEERLIANINSHNFPLFILTNPNRRHCKLLAKTNCKVIYSFISMGFFYGISRFKMPFYLHENSLSPQYKRILSLVRSTNVKLYDRTNFDFSQTKIIPQATHRAFVEDFFQAHNILRAAKEKQLILLNPFVRTAFCNLTVEGWEILCQRLASTYPNLTFIIPTYKANPPIHVTSPHNNIFVFCNNDDVLNLAVLLECARLFISPSTGTAHLANNLCVPMIWLCSKTDSKKWRGENMQKELFVILPKPTQYINKNEEMDIIESICRLFESYIAKYS